MKYGSDIVKKDRPAVVMTKSSTKLPATNRKLSGLLPSGRLVKTLVAYTAFFASGMNGAIIGATLLDLQRQTNSSTEDASLLLCWSSVGKVVGVFTMGLVFDRMNQLLLLATAVCIMAGSCFAVPWCSTYAVLGALMVVLGTALGLVGGNVNPLMMVLWSEKSGPFLQMLYFMLAVGSAVAPLLMEPFSRADDTPVTNQNGVTIGNGSVPTANFTGHPMLKKNLSAEGIYNFFPGSGFIASYHTRDFNTTNFYSTEVYIPTAGAVHDLGFSENGVVRPVFYIIGAFDLLVLCALVCVCFANGLTLTPLKRKKFVVPFTQKSKKCLSIIIKGTISILCLGSGALEISYGGLSLTYAVRYLKWTKSNAAIVTSVYWGCLAGGRAIGTMYTRWNSPHIVLIINYSFLVVATSMLCFAATYHVTVMWFCTAAFGLALSSVHATIFQLAQKYMAVTGKVAAIFIFSTYVGMITMPILCGDLFQNFGEHTFPYALLGAVILSAAALAVTLVTGRPVMVRDKTQTPVHVSLLVIENKISTV